MPDIFKIPLILACLTPALSFSAHAHPDTAAFEPTAFAESPKIADCSLDNGAAAQCHKITVRYLPEGLEIGPFRSATLNDTGGLWTWAGETPGLYRIDGRFLRMLSGLGYRFYNDDANAYSVVHATEPTMTDAPTPLGTVANPRFKLPVTYPLWISATAMSIREVGITGTEPRRI